MGIKERQERDREAVRRAILDAARELFVSEGFQNVSIRKIAERIEYSPAAIYSYFPSKDDIFFALAEEGFRLLAEHGMASVKPLSDPLDRQPPCTCCGSASSVPQPSVSPDAWPPAKTLTRSHMTFWNHCWQASPPILA